MSAPAAAPVRARFARVYLIFHGTSTNPWLFGTSQFIKDDDLTKEEQAGGIVGFLEMLGVKKIRKLCMVACHQAPQKKKDLEKSSLHELSKGFLKWNVGARPKIAGWDSFVSIAEKGEHAGRKQKNPSGDRVDDKFRKGHKRVLVCLNGAYGQPTLEKSGWSDRKTAQTKGGLLVLLK